MRYLLDTNVISELFKSNCHQNILSFVEEVTWVNLYIPAVSLGEICYGIERLPEGKKKHDLSISFYSKVFPWFRKRIINPNVDTFLEWGRIRAKAGRTLPYLDSLIAACAITNNMFLVTRNTKDFDDIDGINMINPWEF